MTPADLSRSLSCRDRAEAVVTAWEEAEGQDMRPGHDETMIRLIAAELAAVARESRERERVEREAKVRAILEDYLDRRQGLLDAAAPILAALRAKEEA